MLRTPIDPRIRCGRAVAEHVPADARIVVSGRSSTDRGRPNNFEDPIVFFYARRAGWSLPSDRHGPAEVEALRQRGARYLVITQPELLTPDLSGYLAGHGERIGQDLGDQCAVYRLSQ